MPALSDCILRFSRTDKPVAYDIFDFCTMMREDCYRAFDYKRILAGFRNSELVAFSPDVLFPTPLPASVGATWTLSLTELNSMFEEKSRLIAQGLDL